MSQQSDSVQKLRRSRAASNVSGSGAPMPPYRWKTRILLPGAVLGAMAVLLFVAGYDSFAPAQAVSVAPVVQKSGGSIQTGGAVVQAAGWIEPDPYSIEVSALADGIVEEVLVLESAIVEKDDVLVKLVADDAQLELQQAEASLHLAEADVEASKAELTASQTQWDNPVELDRAVASRAAELDETKALLNQIGAEIVAETAILQEAERAYGRAESLLKQDDVGTEAQLDKEQARFEAQVAAVDAKEKRRKTVLASITRIEAELLATRENRRLRADDKERLDEAKAALMRAQASVDLARSKRDEKALQMERMSVRAPVSGVVLRRMVQPGAKVVRMMDSAHSSHVMHLYNPEQLQVRVDVPLVDAAQISVGQSTEITVEVLADTVFAGEVTRVTHLADIQKNTLEVKVAIRDPRPELRPEMLARVRFLATSPSSGSGERLAVMAPFSALIQDASGTHAWAVESRRGDLGVARRRTIEPIYGPAGAQWVEIVSGLQPGDRLIVDPPVDLRDGARVRVTSETIAPNREQ